MLQPELGAQADDRGRGHDPQGPLAAGRRAAPSRAALDAARRRVARAGLPDHGRASRASICRVCSASSCRKRRSSSFSDSASSACAGHRLGVVRRPRHLGALVALGAEGLDRGHQRRRRCRARSTHSPASVRRGDQVGRAARHAAEVARAGQRDEDAPARRGRARAPSRSRSPRDVVDVGQRAAHRPPRAARRPASRRGGPQREAHRGRKAGHAPIVGVAADGGPRPWPRVSAHERRPRIRRRQRRPRWQHAARRRHLGGRGGRALGRPRAQRRRQDHPAAAGRRRGCTRPPGVAGVLGEVLGAVDVFELRPRIGLASAAHRRAAARPTSGCATSWSPRRTASSAAGARHTTTSTTPAPTSCWRRSAPATWPTARFGTPQRGRAQAGADRPGADDRPRADAARRAGRRASTSAAARTSSRRLGELAADVDAPALVLVTHHVEEIPPRFTDVLLMREGRVVAAGPIEITLTAENLVARRSACRSSSSGTATAGRARAEPRRLLRERAGAAAAFDAVRGRPAHRREHREAGDGRGSRTTAGWPGSASRSSSAPSRLATVDFVFLMLAGGALAGAARGRPRAPRSPCRCWSRWPWPSLLLLRRAARHQAAVHRPRARHEHRHRGPRSAARPRAVHRDRDDGRVKLGGETWTARTARRRPPHPTRARGPGGRPSTGPPRSSQASAVGRGLRSQPREHPGVRRRRSAIVLLLLVVFVIIVIVRTVRIVPQQTALIIERLGRYSRTLEGGHALPRPVRRQGARQHRPARAGRVLPAAAGHHLRQPRRQHRHGHLLLR